MKKFSSLLLVLLLGCAPAVLADSPLATVKGTTEKVLTLLKNPDLQGDAKKAERRQVVRAEMETRFAWNDSARACLGKHWAKRTPEEQAEFIKLFSDFLKDTYSEKIATYYGELDKVNYQGEKIIEGYASVKIVLTTKAKIDHPVEYRLEKTPSGDDWKVYDVVIEGVSLVKNYRDQFDEIIAKSDYAGLIKEIKARQQAGSQ